MVNTNFEHIEKVLTRSLTGRTINQDTKKRIEDGSNNYGTPASNFLAINEPHLDSQKQLILNLEKTVNNNIDQLFVTVYKHNPNYGCSNGLPSQSVINFPKRQFIIGKISGKLEYDIESNYLIIPTNEFFIKKNHLFGLYDWKNHSGHNVKLYSQLFDIKKENQSYSRCKENGFVLFTKEQALNYLLHTSVFDHDTLISNMDMYDFLSEEATNYYVSGVLNKLGIEVPRDVKKYYNNKLKAEVQKLGQELVKYQQMDKSIKELKEIESDELKTLRKALNSINLSPKIQKLIIASTNLGLDKSKKKIHLTETNSPTWESYLKKLKSQYKQVL